MNVWLIGAGNMALQYVKILKRIKANFVVIGRNQASAEELTKLTGVKVITGGVRKFLETSPPKPSNAIIAIDVTETYSVIELLVDYGVKNILTEKPGFLLRSELVNIQSRLKENLNHVFIGYNRRFYSSVRKLKEFIVNDGGLSSLKFEFTEWSHLIEDSSHPSAVKEKWILANSSHVIDLAFYLAGKPKEMSSFIQNSLIWHHSGAQFFGAGITEKNVGFSYFADWTSSGRWGIEVQTKKNKYILTPLESLFIQPVGSVEKYEVEDIDYTYDINFKPGLFLEVSDFLAGRVDDLVDLEEMLQNLKFYEKMSGERY